MHFDLRLSARLLLVAGAFLSIAAPMSLAQGGNNSSGATSGGLTSLGGNNSSSGGLNSGGLTSGSISSGGSLGTSKGIGSGPLSALTGSNTGLSSLSSGTTTSASTTGIPSASNPYNSFYYNPYGAGLIGGSTSQTLTFGTAVYPITAPTTTTTTIQTTKAAASAAGFTSVGIRKAPTYITTSGDFPIIKYAPSMLQSELQEVLAESTRLNSKNNIRVEVVEGGVVILTGQVESASERRLAEGLIRLNRGVQGVDNRLQFPTQTTQAP